MLALDWDLGYVLPYPWGHNGIRANPVNFIGEGGVTINVGAVGYRRIRLRLLGLGITPPPTFSDALVITCIAWLFQQSTLLSEHRRVVGRKEATSRKELPKLAQNLAPRRHLV